MVLPSLRGENRKLCVRRVIKYYKKTTDGFLQGDKGHLFVSFGGGKKGEPVSNQTIARWLVETVKVSYKLQNLEPPNLKGHSTRGMAASTA